MKCQKLKNICTKIGSGSTPRGGKSAYITKGISLIRSQNVLDFTFSENGLAFINEAQAKALSNVEVHERDVLVNITGDSVARVCQVPKEYVPARVNQHVAILRADPSKLSPDFLKYSLLARNNKERLLSLASTGATRNALTKVMLEDFEISLPDISTQRRIAEILSALDDKIELNRRMNQTLEQMAQTLFKHYFVDGIDKDNLPEGWKWGMLCDVSKNVRNSINPKEQEKECQYVGLDHVPRKSIALYEWGSSDGLESNKYEFEEDNILFGKLRPYFHKVVLAPFEGICSTDILVVKPKEDYQLSFCLFHYSSEEVVQYSNMFSSGTRMPRADWKSLSKYGIAIPPSNVLKDFNNKILPTLEKMKINIREISTLTKTRDTLLPKLMSGEIDVMKAPKDYEPILS